MVWKSRAEREGVPMSLPRVYEGDQPYMFVSYAHADSDAVLPVIAALVAEGYRVWYDDGIKLAEDYPEYIADHVYGCGCLVMFISRSSLSSEWCTQEVMYALDLGKSVLPVYLEEVELTRGLQMRMGGKQALFWHKLDSAEFYRKLFKARRLEPCLTEEGRRRRGVKPRGGGSSDEIAKGIFFHKRVSSSTTRPNHADLSQLVLEAFPVLNALRTGERCLGLPETYQSDAFGDYSFIEFKAIQETTEVESRANG